MTQSIHTCVYGKYVATETSKGISHILFVSKFSKKTELVQREDIDFENPKAYKLDPVGTVFQKEVWKNIRKIKKGQTKTYKQIAEMMGKPKAVRAVANAVAKNNIAILIPCHRVVRTDALMAKFRWGIKMKKELLQSERIQV